MVEFYFIDEDWPGLPCPPPGDLPDPGIKPGRTEQRVAVVIQRTQDMVATNRLFPQCFFLNVALEKDPRPGPLFEGNPVGEGTTRRGTATPGHRPQRTAGATHSSMRGLRPPEQLERPAGFPSSVFSASSTPGPPGSWSALPGPPQVHLDPGRGGARPGSRVTGGD